VRNCPSAGQPGKGPNASARHTDQQNRQQFSTRWSTTSTPPRLHAIATAALSRVPC